MCHTFIVGYEKMTDLEKNIIKSLQQGDEHTFESLFKMYYTKLCVYANNYLHNREEAENVVKDSFIKIWEKRNELLIETSLSGYLYTTVRHQAINHQQRERRKNSFLKSAKEDFEQEYEAFLASTEDYPVANLILQDINDVINRVVNSLPPQCREVFMLSRFEMLSHEEISERTGITVATIKTQIVRALAKLRVELAEYLAVLLMVALLS